jgi:hypothetical protein
MTKVPVGTIFEYNDSYWKVTGDCYSKATAGYFAIKCTKTGKEFKATNTFSATYVEARFNNGQAWDSEYKCGTKVDATNVDRGARRRRIQHLEDTIAELRKELEGLMQREFEDAGD